MSELKSGVKVAIQGGYFMLQNDGEFMFAEQDCEEAKFWLYCNQPISSVVNRDSKAGVVNIQLLDSN